MSTKYDLASQVRIVAHSKDGKHRIFQMIDYGLDETPYYNFEPSTGGHYDIASMLKLKGMTVEDFIFKNLD